MDKVTLLFQHKRHKAGTLGHRRGVSRTHSTLSLLGPWFPHSLTLLQTGKDRTPLSTPGLGLRNQGLGTPFLAKGNRAFQPNWESLPPKPSPPALHIPLPSVTLAGFHSLLLCSLLCVVSPKAENALG